ncbi:angiogenic factor with G patch and FHA domains 1 isoform X3 [Belonocnema kinseyi]|uniref:angiogenic factor with G patch and FHA domains 1 isoform X3 n=1 Tax=Belonocnema kinseyi TaxID=2817044 RepID=UPI00143DDBFA|nr:angiogenic factor with G patch and FHA domains 1 isoform X3 [Belonocnema kinseyi]
MFAVDDDESLEKTWTELTVKKTYDIGAAIEDFVSDDEDLLFDLQQDFSEELDDFPHVMQFIRKCQDRMKRQHKKIKKLRNKLVTLKQHQPSELKNNFVDSETQTTHWDKNNLSLQVWNSNVEWQTGSIVDQVKEAAESALQQTGFVYEETSGLYYDYNTGYYYDAKLGLYYDGNFGRYYYYDADSKSYKFHSQSHSERTTIQQKEIREKTKQKLPKGEADKNKLTREDDNLNEPEEGECSDNSNHSSQDFCSDTSSVNETDKEKKEDLAKIYPPCMRIVVKETNLRKLRLGTLFFVPYTGGSIGREGSHSVLIPDINISKHHARFQYNEVKKQYEIIDLGSRNGTILNNKRLSVAKYESDPHEVVHGSVVQVGCTKLLCHIHSGYETCGNCEPGLLLCTTGVEESSISKKEQHKSELRRLKTKFGVENDSADVASQVAAGYHDRALIRRICFGSSDHHIKTQQSSLDTSIAKDNKGFKLLTRMGWSEGKSLGKDGEGRTEPLFWSQRHHRGTSLEVENHRDAGKT